MSVLAQQKVRLSLVKYAQSDGLSSYNIRQILQDKKGFLWIASQDGLTKFDGKTFVPYTKQSPPKYQISGPDIRKIIEDTLRNSLWVLPNRDRLDVIDILSGEVIKHIPIPKYRPEDWNITMASSKGHLWIGSFCGLKILDTRKWKFIPAPGIKRAQEQSAGTFEVNCIARDNLNNLWVCYTGYGIVIYNGKTLKAITEVRLSELGDYLGSGIVRVNDFTLIGDNVILFATSQGLRKITFDHDYKLTTNNNPVVNPGVLNYSAIDAVQLINPGQVLISGNNHLYRFDTALQKYVVYDESLGQAESKWINYVQSIYRKGDKIWLSCQQGVGMMKADNSPFSKYYYDEKTGNKLEHLRSICVLPDKNILCGLSNGLVMVDHNDNSFVALDKLHLYHHLFADKNNLIFLCRDNGIYLLKNRKIIPVAYIYPEFAKFSTYTINSHIFVADSLALLGTENDNGILIWNYKRHYIHKVDISSRPALASNSVNNIYLDKKGRLWVLSDKLITVINKDFTIAERLDLAAEAKYAKLDLYFDMCEAAGSYWVASYGNGIIELDERLKIKKFIGLQNGLCNEGVYNIFNIRDSSLLITSNNGLSLYNIRKNRFKNYYNENGLQSNAFEEVTSTMVGDKVYAGGINGFTAIDPAKLAINRTPPVFYYKNVEVKLNNGKNTVDACLNIKKLTIPSNWLQASVSFIGLNFDNPKRVTYKYRIKEIDTNWISNGYRDLINVIGLPPNIYTIEVKAANEDGYWSKAKMLILTIEPKWFETWWFKVGLICLVILGLNIFYQYRIKQIKIQQRIRREIANDLHDDLGSNLNSIKIFTHLAMENEKKTLYLQELENLVGGTLAGLRDMLWVLEDANDDVAGLVDRIRKFAVPIAEAHQISFLCTVEKGNVTISKTEKRNLFLIIKEAVNNSFKYAHCNSIRITLIPGKGNKVSIRIEDDGIGFDVGTQSNGYGLSNIQYRATQIKYDVKLLSLPGQGTTIMVEKK
jgi:ligand-binding sensor domain-containing protein/two-component sensor histidine kinase